MMNGWDLQKYERLLVKVKDAGFKLEARSDQIVITTCGGFGSLDEAFAYICGYERGKEKP